MDYKWYFAFMSIGCLLITIAPLQANQWPLISLGGLMLVVSIVGFIRKTKADKKAEQMSTKKKGR